MKDKCKYCINYSCKYEARKNKGRYRERCISKNFVFFKPLKGGEGDVLY